MSDRPTFIYALCEPGTEVVAGELPPPSAVRYVGKTVEPKRRIIYHNYAHTDTYRDRWVRSLRPLRPIMVFLEQVAAGGDWAARETWWIAFYREGGAHLTNYTDGGEGRPGYVIPEETRRAISDSNKRTWSDPDKQANRVGAWKTAYGERPEFREALGDHLRRIRQMWHDSPEMASTMSKAQQRRWQNPEAHTAMSEATKRGMQAPAVQKKMSEASRRRWDDPEKRAAIIAAAQTPEAKAKRVAACAITKARKKAEREQGEEQGRLPI